MSLFLKWIIDLLQERESDRESGETQTGIGLKLKVIKSLYLMEIIFWYVQPNCDLSPQD